MKPKYVIPLTSGLISALLGWATLRHGVYAFPDSWAYWEGAVSIVERGEYAYFGGQPILLWPPLYSGFLAVLQILFGISGGTMILAMVLLLALNTVVWSRLAWEVLQVSKVDDGHRGRLIDVLVLAFVVAFLVSQFTTLLANDLQLLFVGMTLLLGRPLASTESPTRYTARVLTLAAVLSLALLAHNSSLAFVFASIVFLWINPRQQVSRKVLHAALLILLPTLAWHGIRLVFSQVGSNPVQPGAAGSPFGLVIRALETFGAYFLPVQLSGVGRGLPPGASGAKAFILPLLVSGLIISARLPRLNPIRSGKSEATDAASTSARERNASVIFALVAFAMLYGMFNVMLSMDPLCPRFLWCFPLILVPIGVVELTRRSRWVGSAACLLFLTVPIARTTSYALKGVVPGSATLFSPSTSDVIFPKSTIGTMEGPPPAGLIRVDPPNWSWVDRNFKRTKMADPSE